MRIIPFDCAAHVRCCEFVVKKRVVRGLELVFQSWELVFRVRVPLCPLHLKCIPKSKAENPNLNH
eukprot:1091604-Rhodomonas_salina.2